MSAGERPELYTGPEVAALLRVNEKTVNRWALKGRIRSIITPGGHRRYFAKDVHAILDPPEADTSTAPPKPAPKRTPKPVEEPPKVDPPLVAYKDAVIDALMAAGIGVRDNEADDSGVRPALHIELDPDDLNRTPVMKWAPRSGWSIAYAVPGSRAEVRRYLALGKVPRPDNIVRMVKLWLDDPGNLGRLEPFYETEPRPNLDRRLAERAQPDP